MNVGQFSNILVRESKEDNYDTELVFDAGTENEPALPPK